MEKKLQRLSLSIASWKVPLIVPEGWCQPPISPGQHCKPWEPLVGEIPQLVPTQPGRVSAARDHERWGNSCRPASRSARCLP